MISEKLNNLNLHTAYQDTFVEELQVLTDLVKSPVFICFDTEFAGFTPHDVYHPHRSFYTSMAESVNTHKLVQLGLTVIKKVTADDGDEADHFKSHSW